MKKLSIQTRLVLFHTAAMTLVVALVLGLLFSLSSQEILTSAQATLEERVSQGVEEVEYTQDRLEFDSELLSLENGVYLSVYQPGDSSMLYGRLPYGFAYTLPLSDGELRTVTAGGTEYSVLDLQFPVEGYGTLVMRGVVSLTAAERDFRATLRLALVLLPLLVALTALCGYLFSRRALRPVAQITQTVQNIQQERDLSKRVRLGEGRDEIYTLAQTFDSLLDQVEASFRREKQFTSDVAHELRTPLTAITGWAETIQSGELRDPKDVRKGMDIIVSEARRLTNMVEELLEFSRMSDGRFTLSVEPLDLKAELEDAVYTYREFFRREGIELTYQDCPEEAVLISGDPERLRQVFCNLLDNAGKHGGSGKRIDVSIAQEEESAVIRIRDYGPGIPEEELPHVKYKFYKGSSKTRGSGIGLAVCEEIVTRHEGTLDIGNAEGGGCLVTVRLPIET